MLNWSRVTHSLKKFYIVIHLLGQFTLTAYCSSLRSSLHSRTSSSISKCWTSSSPLKAGARLVNDGFFEKRESADGNEAVVRCIGGVGRPSSASCRAACWRWVSVVGREFSRTVDRLPKKLCRCWEELGETKSVCDPVLSLREPLPAEDTLSPPWRTKTINHLWKSKGNVKETRNNFFFWKQ